MNPKARWSLTEALHFKIREKGETQWATKAARKIRRRGRSRTLINRNKSQKTSLTSSQKEGLDSVILGIR
jgi:hypothetical protein